MKDKYEINYLSKQLNSFCSQQFCRQENHNIIKAHHVHKESLKVRK